jgi:glycosyltransferase involved in cell wall biosynthesis
VTVATADEPRRLRVLHLILVVGPTNGQYNEHCLPLARERDISIVSFFPPKLTPVPEITLFAGDGTVRGFYRALRRALDAGDYDIVHAHAPHTAMMLVLGLVRLGRYRRLRPSLVYTVQDSFYDYKPRNQAMMVLSLPAFERVVFCSHAAYDSLPRPWKRLVRGRWRVVQNGADMERIDRALRSEPVARDDEGFSIISVGRLDRVKDPLSLVDAFALVADDHDGLTFAGAGELEDDVRARAGTLGLADRVHLAGLIPRDEVYRRCAGADLFVSTSHGEGLPVAVVEAMASGCPVILSDIPPHREVTDGDGFVPLVPVDDVSGFAREIRRFRDMSPDERREIGRRCREHVEKRFSLETMHASLDEVYRELVSPPEPVPER